MFGVRRYQNTSRSRPRRAVRCDQDGFESKSHRPHAPSESTSFNRASFAGAIRFEGLKLPSSIPFLREDLGDGPVFPLKSRNDRKVRPVPSDQCRTGLQRNARDPQVHGLDFELDFLERATASRSPSRQ